MSLSPLFEGHQLQVAMAVMLVLIVVIMAIYSLRQFIFTLNRLTGVQRHPYIDISVARWPWIAVLVTAHNDEKMLTQCVNSLLNTDYPLDRLKIILCAEDSQTAVTAVITNYVRRFPGIIAAFQPTQDLSDKSAALKEVWFQEKGDIAIMFNAQDVPGRCLLKQLVAPFFDPEIGAVMGRVVPVNSGFNLMTRLIDLEHSANDQIHQQAHMNLNLLPQCGGTVSGIRLSAVSAVGGWHDDAWFSDADMTLRLMLNGWKTVYANRAEFYEVVAEDWRERIDRKTCMLRENMQLMVRYWWPLASTPNLTLMQRINALLSLFAFVMPVIVLLGWCLILGLYLLGSVNFLSKIIPIYVLMTFGMLGHSVAFFEMMVAVVLDGNRRRIRLLPFNLLDSCVNLLHQPKVLCRLFLYSAFKHASGRKNVSPINAGNARNE